MKTRLRGERRRLDLKELSLIMLAAVGLGLLWHTPLAFPLRFFSVLVHECSHAVAGMLTGGRVSKIVLDEHHGGLTFIQGGIPAIYGSAGYLGSVFFGCLLLYLSRAARRPGRLCLGVGLALTILTLSFVSPLTDFFGFCYGSIAGLLIALVGWKFDKAAPYFMKFLGVAVCLFACMDILSTLFSSAAALSHSDAGILARATGIPAILWAVSWLAFSAAMLLFFGYLAATRSATGSPSRGMDSLRSAVIRGDDSLLGSIRFPEPRSTNRSFPGKTRPASHRRQIGGAASDAVQRARSRVARL